LIVETSVMTAFGHKDEKFTPNNLALSQLPRGLESWLVDYIGEAQRISSMLRENGAHSQATARDSLLEGLLRKAADYFDERVNVAEAAAILGQSEETVRRAIRDGRVPDDRTSSRGHHRPKRGDVLSLARGRAIKYDPIADAQDIAKLRKSA
jgi:hypothetical protein